MLVPVSAKVPTSSWCTLATERLSVCGSGLTFVTLKTSPNVFTAALLPKSRLIALPVPVATGAAEPGWTAVPGAVERICARSKTTSTQ